MPLRTSGPDIITAADKKAIARVSKKKNMVVTGRHSKPREVKNPVTGFLHAATGFVKEAIDYSKDDWSRTAKKAKTVYKAVDRYGDERLESLKPHWREKHKPYDLKTAKVNALDVSPGGLSGIIRAGGATILNSGKLDLPELLSRLPKQHSKASKVARVPEGRQTGDINVGGRIPWLVDRTTGEVHVGPIGANHGALYPPGARISNYRQGWMYNPAEDYINLTLGTGNPMTKLSPHEEKGLYQLLYHFFGYDSPITDSMVKTQKSGFGFAERQGAHRTAALDAKLPKMSHKEFQEFLEEELRRKRGR